MAIQLSKIAGNIRAALALASALTAMILSAHGSCLAQERAAPEYEVKAAFLLNFIKFIEWPDGAEKRGATICILGTDPFGARLDSLAVSQNPPPLLRRLSKIENTGDCNLLFIGRSAADELDKIITFAISRSIVTVSDIPGFVAKNGTIGLLIEDERVRFDIGITAARDSKVVISSKLLSLARNRED